MKRFFHSRDGASKGAALMIVLAFVVLLAGVALAYFSRTTTDRQLAQSSHNDTSADLLARSALDIVVNDFKQEILNGGAVTRQNIQPQRSGDNASIPNLIRRSVRNDPIPVPGVSSLASAMTSGPLDPTNPKRGEIKSARWNSHYLIPRANTSDSTIDSTPISAFTAPDWVLTTRNGPVAFSGWQNSLKDPTSSNTNYVVGRYAFAVYDEGGLLDMTMAGYPSWSGTPPLGCNPSPTPWLVNVGRKGIMAFADLTALPFSSATPSCSPASLQSPQDQVDSIVGWRNYAMTQRTFTGFPCPSPSPIFAGTDCKKQDFYGTYLLYFGDPPFIIDSRSDKLLASIYPFTSVSNYMYPPPASGPTPPRTDQSLTTRQELLRLQRTLGFSQNVLQYMGTFSRERNRPAPDWPGLAGRLSEGRFNLTNLALVQPNPADCVISHGKKTGWQTGKNKNHLCGDSEDLHRLFGLFWVRADVIGGPNPTGEWRYIGNRAPLPGPTASPAPIPLNCGLVGPTQQNDFFQILDYALFQAACETDPNHLDKTFSIGASLIDQYDTGEGCLHSGQSTYQPDGCDLDYRAINTWNKQTNATHTTKILYANGNHVAAYGMEPNYSAGDPNAKANGDDPYDPAYAGNNPHRPQNAPDPIPGQTQVISHAFATVGEFGYGINTSDATLPTLKFWDTSTSPPFQYAPVLDFFSYNPISSAYPRAGIVNLYTKNAPVIAAMLKSTLKNDALTSPPSTGVVSQTEAMNAANAIVSATQSLLAGTAIPAVQQTDLTRAIAGRLANVGSNAAGWISDEQKESIARGLAEMGQTRTWNLLIDVIAQTGHYGPNAQNLTDFIPEGEKRYWLHIALGRDLIQGDGLPCGTTPGAACQVDVLGTQLEEVTE